MNYYLLFKALHLIAIISWMAGLLYLPRIFVYHSETKNNQEKKDTFKIMEKRLFFYIMNPAMILSWIFGLLLLHSIGPESLSSLWLQIKLVLVIILTAPPEAPSSSGSVTTDQLWAAVDRQAAEVGRALEDAGLMARSARAQRARVRSTRHEENFEI